MLEEGARMLERCRRRAGRPPSGSPVVEAVSAAPRHRTARRRPARTPRRPPRCAAWFARHPFREMVSPSPAYRLLVERELALFGAWYEIFPRSEGAYLDPETGQWRSGTLRTAAERLPRHRRDGLRRRLPHPDPPHRDDRAQGPEQHPERRTERPRQPVRHRLAGRRARLDPPGPRARSTTSTSSSGRLAATGSRSPSTSPSRPPPTTPGSRPTPSGSPRGPTARSRTRRTRRRSTRTSTR